MKRQGVARILMAERLGQNDVGSERSWNLFSAGSTSFPSLRRMGHRGIGLVQLAVGRADVLGMGLGLGEIGSSSRLAQHTMRITH